MNGQRLVQVVIGVLLVAVIAVPVGFRLLASEPGASGGGGVGDEKLIIITPHNEQIRYEMARGFNAWRVANGKSPITFDWRASGGTSDLRRGILAQYAALIRKGGVEAADQGIGADLFFGGGGFDHNRVARGVDPDGDGPASWVSVVAAPTLPAGLLDTAIPDREAFGTGSTEVLVRTDDAGEVRWIGTALSSFGIVFNRDALARLGLPEPRRWSDLADPRYRDWVALADPSHSGSASASYNTILQRRGWTEGWQLLRRVYANSRYFTNSASKVPVDVAKRDAAAGMAIDFYGRFQAGALPMDPDRVGYVDPVMEVDGKLVSLTATTPDPVTLLRGAPSEALASEFIAWLLMPEAQRLWQLKLDAEGGPELYELRRQPIRPDLYADRAGWADPEVDPYATASKLHPAVPNYFSWVSVLTQSMATDIHDDLREAWKALVAAEEAGHPNLAEMRRLFDAMPAELVLEMPSGWQDALGDAGHPEHAAVVAALGAWEERLDEVQKTRRVWREFFQGNYREVVRLGRE
ncbi:MAG: extracellular solute-binding protein [Planctomycetota bacterium]